MEKHELTQNDKENIKKLMFISESIKHYYDMLIELETTDKKDSDAYQYYLNKINELLQIEVNIYQSFGNNIAKIYNIQFYLNNYNYNDFNGTLNVARDNQVEKLAITRILRRIETIIETLEFNHDELNDEDEYDFNDGLFDFEREELIGISELCVKNFEEDYKYQNKLDLGIETDIINTILKLLSLYIYNPQYQDIKDSLTRFKYYIAYLFSQVEEDFLKNNFEINTNLFWQSKLVVDLSRKSIEELEDTKNIYSVDILYAQLDNLINLFFSKSLSKDDYVIAIITQIIIRANLLFVDNKIVQIYQDFIIEELKTSGKINKEVEAIILDAINNVKEDKNLPQIISFKLN